VRASASSGGPPFFREPELAHSKKMIETEQSDEPTMRKERPMNKLDQLRFLSFSRIDGFRPSSRQRRRNGGSRSRSGQSVERETPELRAAPQAHRAARFSQKSGKDLPRAASRPQYPASDGSLRSRQTRRIESATGQPPHRGLGTVPPTGTSNSTKSPSCADIKPHTTSK